MRWFYRSCEAVFTPSRGVERELAARGLAVRFEPLDQAVDAEAFSPGRRDATLHHELGGEGHVILWVGRVSAEKNLELLAKAYAAIRAHRDDVSLVIVGDGPYRKTLEEVAPEATYLGFRSGEELARIYASSDVFVFPGAAETFGQVVLEAAMSGLPTVVTAGSIPSEAVVPGETALTVSPGNVDGMRDAIETLLDDPALRARMGAAARDQRRGTHLDEGVRALQGRLRGRALVRSRVSAFASGTHGCRRAAASPGRPPRSSCSRITTTKYSARGR